jgi:hypothetical protein
MILDRHDDVSGEVRRDQLSVVHQRCTQLGSLRLPRCPRHDRGQCGRILHQALCHIRPHDRPRARPPTSWLPSTSRRGATTSPHTPTPAPRVSPSTTPRLPPSSTTAAPTTAAARPCLPCRRTTTRPWPPRSRRACARRSSPRAWTRTPSSPSAWGPSTVAVARTATGLSAS